MERTPSGAAPPRTSMDSGDDGGERRRSSERSSNDGHLKKTASRTNPPPMKEVVNTDTSPTGSRDSVDSRDSVGSAHSVGSGHSVGSVASVQVDLRARVRGKRVTLVGVNRVGFTAAFGSACDEEKKVWMEGDIPKWCESVAAFSGVVDVVCGDRRFASFNAVSKCDGHAPRGISVVQGHNAREDKGKFEILRTFVRQRSLREFGSLRATGVVVTGQVICGDFGSDSFLRFMVLGKTACSLYALERTASAWQVSCLADSEAYKGPETPRGVILGEPSKFIFSLGISGAHPPGVRGVAIQL